MEVNLECWLRCLDPRRILDSPPRSGQITVSKRSSRRCNMRITAISNSRIPSTTANSIQAMKVCDALVECGHKVQLVAPAETTGANWDELQGQYGVRNRFVIEWLPSRKSLHRLDFILRARALARSHHAELVYTWLPQSGALEAWNRRPVILEMHADVAGVLGPWWLRQFWTSPRGRLLVTTSALRRALERSTGMRFPEDSVLVAPNGVDLERYADLPDPEAARALVQLPQQLTVGFTGHFYAGRGLELLFELARSLPSLQFLWVGGTPDAVQGWRNRIEAARLGNVVLTGFVDNSRLPFYQAAAEILLMPYTTKVSASSGQDIAEVINPMKMFEYMAAGRAIITADLPVIREVLDETSAVFCRPGDVEHWREAITRLANNPAERLGLAENARRGARTRTWVRREQRALENFNLK